MTALSSHDRGHEAQGRAYYNEIDPYAAQWLRNLIAAGLIAPGDVDTRSIADVRPDDLRPYTQCHFFAGIGGWSYALRQAGWDDDRPVWTGSCPCQPFSSAGKQKGFADDRHLWPVWRELIRERSPAVVFGEQVARATAWLRLVRSDLEHMGYAVGAMPIEASSAGADHKRERFWFVADSGCEQSPRSIRIAEDDNRSGSAGARGEQGCQSASRSMAMGDAAGHGCSRIGLSVQPGRSIQAGPDIGWADGSGLVTVDGADGRRRRIKPGVRLLAHGVSGRVGKLRGFGNAIDPRPASAFIGAFIDTMRAPALSSNHETKDHANG